MEIIRLSYPFADQLQAPRQVMAVGYFDGVHLGHQQVIQKAIYTVLNGQAEVSSIMTFHPHPREVLGQFHHQQYITPLEEKLEQFNICGIDRTYVLTFDRTLSLLTPEQFVNNVLFPLNVDTVVVGFNFTYGHLGRGTVDMLRESGGDRMKVSVVRPFHLDDCKVSSTVIREKLHAGEMAKVNELLGRPYSITGTVVKGMGRGRTIGIPTANIEPSDNYVIPRNGVYAVKVTVNGNRFNGVMNIGFNPTFDDNSPRAVLEVHIPGFDRIIYGESVKIEWIEYIRPEQKFSSIEQLTDQIHKDIGKARTILSFTS